MAIDSRLLPRLRATRGISCELVDNNRERASRSLESTGKPIDVFRAVLLVNSFRGRLVCIFEV